jgi:hypothetical protein
MNQQEIVQESKTVQSEVTNPQMVSRHVTNNIEENVSQNGSNSNSISGENTVVSTTQKTNETNELKRHQILEERHKSAHERHEKFIKRKEMISVSELHKTSTTSSRKVALPGENFIIPKLNNGFYVVANVFAKPRNAERFTEYLKSIGISANFFINPHNNLRYVYVKHTENWEDALKLYYSDVDGKYQGDMWIMIVNTALPDASSIGSTIQTN